MTFDPMNEPLAPTTTFGPEGSDERRPAKTGGRVELGRNDWGNLYRRVVHRRISNIGGFIVSDMGETQAVADAEDGWPILAPTADWVGYGSQAHIERDAHG